MDRASRAGPRPSASSYVKCPMARCAALHNLRPTPMQPSHRRVHAGAAVQAEDDIAMAFNQEKAPRRGPRLHGAGRRLLEGRRRRSRRRRRRRIKVGVLHSLSGTMAISEVTVKNATQLAIDEINAAGGVLGKQIAPVDRGRRFGPGDLRAEGLEADRERRRRHRVRRLDLGEPQGDAAGVREDQEPAVVSGAVRGQRMLAQHHVFGRAAQPADPARL